MDRAIFRHPLFKYLGLTLIACAILFLAVGPLLPRLIDISTYQQQIVTLLEDSLKRRVSLGEIRFEWNLGPEFVVSNLHLRERNSEEEFLKAGRVGIRPALLPLLQRKLVLKRIVVDDLRGRLLRNPDGSLSIDDLLRPAAGGPELQFKEIRLRRADLLWIDRAAPGGELTLQLRELDLSLQQPARGKKCSFKIKAQLTGEKPGQIKGKGTVRLPAPGKNLADTLDFNGNIELSQIEYSRIWPYLTGLVPFGRPGGLLDLELNLKGTPSRCSAKGQLKLHRSSVVWPAVFHGPLAPRLFQLGFELKRTPDALELPTIKLAADGFALRGSLKLSELQGKDPLLSAKAVTEPFEYRNVRSYIPFGIIEKDTADFIEHKIKAGLFKLDTGTLEGRFSKLARFTEGDNAAALFISGTAQQAVISYGPQIPSFNQIKGGLELKGRHFNLHKASGFFGGSPFTAHGTITEYATMNVPSEYPFQMEITPRTAEVAWLAGLVGADALSFGGMSHLRLTGQGPVKAYQLAGDWQLANAVYAYPRVIRKPSGMANSLSFSSVLTKRDVRLTSLTYSLPPLQLSALGSFRHGDDPPHLAFELQTNSFALGASSPLFTGWQQYQPRGQLQAHLTGTGDPRDLSAMLYNGTVRLGSFSLRPLEQYAPLNAINGVVTFKGNSLESSSIAVRYGSTPLTIQGRIASLHNPEAELFITSPNLRPADFGLSAEARQIRRFSANLGIRPGTVTLRNVSGQLDKSILSVGGTVTTGPEPDINLQLNASHLDFEELLPFFTPPPQPERPANGNGGQQHGAAPAPFRLRAQLFAEAGAYRELAFKKLTTTISNEGTLLRLNNLEAHLFGGQLTANGQLERLSGRPNRWNLNLALNRVKSDEVLHSLGLSRETRGLMTIKGTMRAQGDSLNELKRSATGNLSLKIERGVLRRFSSLSKVFSLLNVSQLLTFRLPDMDSEGMPFNQISATVGVKDGLLTSQDFFIDSNAMHLSMVGKVDIVKEQLDLLIGVQPLQTVDKVISRIPVVGWILTGGDGSLITTYFEAKGSWDNPEVTAVPVKSIAGGTLDIFRRVFELPVRLFTDTGEVILGNQKERPKAKQE